MKKTALNTRHIELGAKMVEFAGWHMPIQYTGLREEHQHVREHVGLFDVSHMGEIRVRGAKSLSTLQWLTSNDVSRLKKGEAQYSLFPNFQGGVVDDLIIYCFEPGEDYLLCVNASNTQKDLAWVMQNNRGADITDESETWSQIAIQGPEAIALAREVLGEGVNGIAPFQFRLMDFEGSQVVVAATGYTGEAGFEVFVPNDRAVALWDQLLVDADGIRAKPIGLGARDTLRTEMKYSLYGHEIDDTTNPYEAGLGWVVKPDAKDFIGKELILKTKLEGLKRKLVGFKMIDRGIARQGYPILNTDGAVTGIVTSGTPSPTLSENIGIGYVALDQAQVGSEIHVEIRGKKIKAEVVSTPFVKK